MPVMVSVAVVFVRVIPVPLKSAALNLATVLAPPSVVPLFVDVVRVPLLLSAPVPDSVMAATADPESGCKVIEAEVTVPLMKLTLLVPAAPVFVMENDVE